jgi:hypothetical protein
MLIIGGLLALAIVAILGAILLGIGEERAKKKPGDESAALPMQALPTPQVPETPQASNTVPPPTPPVESQMSRPLAPPLRENGLLSAYRNSHMPGHREEEYTMIPNSQVHKFADELRFLAQQTSELEQHLTSLRKAIEDLQDQQSEVTTKHHAVKLDNPSF